jgi:hypothetical protein
MGRIAASILAIVVIGLTIAAWRGAGWDPIYALIALVEAGTVAIIVWMGGSIVVGRLRRRSDSN